MRVKRCYVSFADAFDSLVGGQGNKNEVAAAMTGWRVAYHKGFDFGDFHGLCLGLVEYDDRAQGGTATYFVQRLF